LDFKKTFKFSSAVRVQSWPERHSAKFCCNSLNDGGEMALLSFKNGFPPSSILLAGWSD